MDRTLPLKLPPVIFQPCNTLDPNSGVRVFSIIYKCNFLYFLGYEYIRLVLYVYKIYFVYTYIISNLL